MSKKNKHPMPEAFKPLLVAVGLIFALSWAGEVRDDIKDKRRIQEGGKEEPPVAVTSSSMENSLGMLVVLSFCSLWALCRIYHQLNTRLPPASDRP
jgi:hypothetical protein